MSSPASNTPSHGNDVKDTECDNSSKSSSSNHIQNNQNGTSTLNCNSVPTGYNLFKSFQFSRPTSDSDDSMDGISKYGQKRSDTLPNSYFSSLPSLGFESVDLYLDSYSSDEESKAKPKIFGKGKSLLKKNAIISDKNRCSDTKLKDSILASFAETSYKCKLCKVAPCYMASVESFIFHMKNQHSEIYKDLIVKSVANGNCRQGYDDARFDGSSSDDGSCNYNGRITSEHLLQYSKLWQNSPKSSATDPKISDEVKLKSSSTNSSSTSTTLSTTTTNPIQIVTEQILKTSSSHIDGAFTHYDHAHKNGSPSCSSTNTNKKSPTVTNTQKADQNGWKSDLPPSFTPEFGRYTKLVREGGNVVYFCQVCNWKCQVKAAFTVHCNGQQHHNKVRLADQNNFDKCKQKTEPNNVKAAIRKAITYRDSISKQSTNSSVKLPIINVPKVPKFNTVNSDTSKELHRPEIIEQPAELEKEKPECRNKRKRPVPKRRSSAEEDDWADTESDEEVDRKKNKLGETMIEAKDIDTPIPSSFIGPYPSMIHVEDYFTRYSAPKSQIARNVLLFENDDKKIKMEFMDDRDIPLNIPLFPTGSTGLFPESREDNTDIQYRCTFCNVFCAGLSDYKDHFRMEHDIESPDLTMADGKGGQNNEWWKMMKIKETLSELLIICPKGNVSRDLLLHKVSLTLNMPEVIRWGPSCNKAVREEFPHSMAQRKGKFKNYFFGVALIEHLQEQEADVSDGEMSYQPLRDMSHDLERILEHLSTLIKWTGNQVVGISRDDVLELLAQKLDDRDVIHWGVQCNRAVRMMFPDVQMKRKGKYKTTVFYGVDFIEKTDKQMVIRSMKLNNDKDDVLPIHFRDEDMKVSPYGVTNPMLGYNPLVSQHNELALQYQSQLFNMWRFMSPYHPFPLNPSTGMVGMGGNSFTKGTNSISSASSPNRDLDSPVLSVGSKSDLDQFIGGNSKSPLCVEETGQTATNCSVEERRDRDLNILSASPLPVVSS